MARRRYPSACTRVTARCRQERRSTTSSTLLDLEPIEVNIFRGRSPDEERQRVFGGQVAGQALVAAARTVDDRRPRACTRCTPTSCAPATRRVPILYEVDRIRDGRVFTTRRVVAIQHGKAIFNLQASFHVHEDGPRPPGPDAAERARSRDAARLQRPAWRRTTDALGDWYDRPRPIDMRYVDGDPLDREAAAAAVPAGVAARRRRAARRPGAARLRRHVRVAT